ncbi:MAG: hypothetical protein WCY41_00240 [Candidatus Micrarchaeia archaeon]
MNEPLERQLQKGWDGTCRAVFGEEVGALHEFEAWLSSGGWNPKAARSSVSGKEIYFGVDCCPKGAKNVGFDEVGTGKKFEPLSINGIKDMDSLIEAVQERAQYAGSVMLGNCSNVEKSSNISDSHYILGCDGCGDSKCLAHTRFARLCESVFGSDAPGESSFCIKCNDTYRAVRSFELWRGGTSSDCYYAYNLDDCADCMFCFQLKGKRHHIGNLELPKAKYLEIKRKLVAEMAQALGEKKRLPSLAEIAGNCPKPDVKGALFGVGRKRMEENKARIEEAFSDVSGMLLGKKLAGMDGYGEWLEAHTRKIEEGKSAFSGERVLIMDYARQLDLPKGRLATYHEAYAWGETAKISEEEAGRITLGNAHAIIGNIAYFSTEHYLGVNRNIIECPVVGNCTDCYRLSPSVLTKSSAFCFWPRSSERCFGCSVVFDSGFCMDCYHSVKLQRCFECDSCRSSSDCYFCHNAENCHDCLFCFNVKNLRYAVGNVEVGKEEYARVKRLVLAEIGARLEKDKKLGLSIYSIGAKG